MKIGMNNDELTLCLKASLDGEGGGGSFEKEMKKDFRKLEARFVCMAVGVEEERCTRFVPHAMGCTFKGENGVCLNCRS
jgi:hypothetical protein